MERPEKKRLSPEAILGIIAACCAAALLVLVLICLPYFGEDEDPETIVHHKPMVETEPTGATEPDPTMPTVPPPEKNPYGRMDFQYEGRYLKALRCDSMPGIDVSAYQGKIDWEKVADSGIEFAIIRLGYRGYGTGVLVEDKYARANLEGATKAGLEVGAYFFSQALNEEEVHEEIDFMLEILGDTEITMPVVFDWEYVNDEARTANMDDRTLTDLNLIYCQRMEQEGYQPMIYFNSNQARKLLFLYELEEYPFWLAYYSDRMNYPYRFEMWQYSCTGRVPGIEGDVDLNILLLDQKLRPQ